jgi:uncharacterized membrane protein
MGVVAVLLLLLVASVYFYNSALSELAAGSCSDVPGDCPHETVVETQNLIISFLIIVVGIMAAWLIYSSFFASKAERPQEGEARAAQRKKRVSASELDADETKVAAIINSSGGSVFQSDITGKTGYSKVKVSRVLDRLEHKGLVERKRRGMANLVVAK